ncbi:MAG TPA: hypothetical protein VF263_15645 [Longimicrobiaceae bacterium]
MERSFLPRSGAPAAPAGVLRASRPFGVQPVPAPSEAAARLGHDFARVAAGGTAPIQRVVKRGDDGKYYDDAFPDATFDTEEAAEAHAQSRRTAAVTTDLVHDAERQFQAIPSASTIPHLNRGTADHREADIVGPEDRAALARETVERGTAPTVRLNVPRVDHPNSPVATGRVQRFPTNPSDVAVYDPHNRPPSYPDEASHLRGVAHAHGLSGQESLQHFASAISNPIAPSSLTLEEQAPILTGANIQGISELNRGPGMAAMDNLAIANAVSSPSATAAELFGSRSGRRNEQGTLPASGTGAKRSTDVALHSIEHDQDVSTSAREVAEASGSSTRPNISETQARHDNILDTVRDARARHERAEEENADSRGLDEDDRKEVVDARVSSGLRREALGPAGLLQHGLRPIGGPPSGPLPSLPETGPPEEDEFDMEDEPEAEEPELEDDPEEEDAPEDLTALVGRKRPSGSRGPDPKHRRGGGAGGSSNAV